PLADWGFSHLLYCLPHYTGNLAGLFQPSGQSFPARNGRQSLSIGWEAWYNIGSGPEKRGQTLFVLPFVSDPMRSIFMIQDSITSSILSTQNTTKTPACKKSLEHHLLRLQKQIRSCTIAGEHHWKPMLMDKLNICCSRFDDLYAANKSIKLEWALKSLTIDMVSEFCFGQSLGALYDDDFMSGPVQVFRAYLHSLHVIKAFPFVRSISQILPYAIAKRLSKTIKMANELESFSRKRVDAFITAYEGGSKPNFPTLMERLLTPQEEKNFKRAFASRDEILTMISAGYDTTGITSMVGIYQIIRNPAIQSRLLAELKTVLPGPSSEAPYVQIEELPYLSAVIKESLRYASAAASRTPRLVPAGGVYLPDGRFIPAGTRVDMAIYHVHYNPDIFPSPREFIPERWLDAVSGGSMPDHLVEMNRFLVPFSKGTRSCIGINLAHMKLYNIMAYLIRRYDFQTDTTDADMRWDDMVVAWFHGDFTVKAKRRSE
ncbi:hypothetical protein D6D05_05030, partial [Aureobasidium pullulans]